MRERQMQTLSPSVVFECFINSTMTIHDEYKHDYKYHYLKFVEFQEMVCRIAMLGFEEQDTVDFKVYFLLEHVWEYMYQLDIWTPETMPLARPNQSAIIR